MLGADGFQNYITKHKDKLIHERLQIIVEDIIKSGKIYKLKNEYDSFYPIGKSLIEGGNKHLILYKKN